MRIIFILLTVFTVGRCESKRPDFVWIHPDLRQKLHVIKDSAKVKASSVWVKRNGYSFVWKKGIDKSLLFKSRYLVMVSYSPGSELERVLRHYWDNFVFIESNSQRHGVVILGADDASFINQISHLAHAGRSFACGNVELLNLTQNQRSSSNLGPIFGEHVLLPSVSSLLQQADRTRIQSSIAELENLGTRHHLSSTGLATTAKVQQLFETAASSAEPSFAQISHSDVFETEQKSLVVTLAGTDLKDETVIIGAHLDSINRKGSGKPAPGADDDASGIATLVEVARIVAQNGMKFRRNVELHAYAAEEVALVGSGHLAQTYRQQARKIAAMMQIDMNSYAVDPSSKTIYLVTNDTDPTLRQSVKDLLTTYLGGDFLERSLVGGSSDHRSWTNNGFPAVFPFEDPKAFNFNYHTEDDTLATANNLGLSERFVKLTIAFLAHYAGLADAQAEYAAALATTKASLSPDLKLAVIDSDEKNAYFIGIGTVPTVKTVQLCTIDSAGAAACTGERVTTTTSSESAGRQLFISDKTMTLSGGDRIAIFGYDAADQLVAQRSVRLENSK